MPDELLTTKDNTVKIIVNYNKDPFTDDNAEQVVYAIFGKGNQNRKKFTSDSGFKELFGKVLVGALMNEKGQIVFYFEDNDIDKQAEVVRNLVSEARKLDEEAHDKFQRNKIVDNFDRYTNTGKPEPLKIEPKEKLMEKYKGKYTEQEIDMLINKVDMINAVDRFTGSV